MAATALPAESMCLYHSTDHTSHACSYTVQGSTPDVKWRNASLQQGCDCAGACCVKLKNIGDLNDITIRTVHTITYYTQSCEQDRSCAAWATCKAGEFESVGPSRFENRRCLKAKTCDDKDVFTVVQPTPKTDTVCGKITACTTKQWETAAPTKFSDRLCKALTVCKLPAVESTKPTKTTDRVCLAPKKSCTDALRRPATHTYTLLATRSSTFIGTVWLARCAQILIHSTHMVYCCGCIRVSNDEHIVPPTQTKATKFAPWVDRQRRVQCRQ